MQGRVETNIGARPLAKGQTGEIDLAARVARLTAGQRACLNLVDDHATSKEIALQLGISRHTVDARLRHAMQVLGVASRREAAIIWRTASGAVPYQPFAYQPSRIVGAPAPAEVSGSDWLTETAGDGRAEAPFGAGEGAPIGVADAGPEPGFGAAGRPFEVADAAWGVAPVAGEPGWPDAGWPGAPRLWGGANELTIPQRLAGIMIVAILGMLAFGLLLSGMAALTSLRT